MEILKNLTFPRVVILASYLGSAVLAYLVYQQQAQLQSVEDALAAAPRRLQGIQAKVLQIKDLERQVESEGLGRQDDPELYIRTLASSDDVNIGTVDVSTSKSQPVRGARDNKFKIKQPSRQNETFKLGQIANFMYLLEKNSRRVRVTEVDITPKVRKGERTPKKYDVLPDDWDFSISITTREKTDD